MKSSNALTESFTLEIFPVYLNPKESTTEKNTICSRLYRMMTKTQGLERGIIKRRETELKPCPTELFDFSVNYEGFVYWSHCPQR